MTSAKGMAGAELTVLAGGGVVPGLKFVAEAFCAQTGHTVEVIHGGVEAIKLMDEGTVFDLIAHPRENIDQYFGAAGKVEQGAIAIGHVGVGVLIRPDAPVPDISSAEGLRHSVLDAESILYTTATSGRYVESMLRKIGIYGQTQAKTTRFPHGPELMDRVLSGKGKEFAFLPITEILTYRDKGIVLVGPLPEALQHLLHFWIAASTMSAHKDLAWEFARYCAGPGRTFLVEHGVQ